MSEGGSDSEDGRESPIFGFSYDEEGKAHSFWAIDPNVAVKSESDVFDNDNLATEITSRKLMSPPKTVGFSTASGKPIAISEKAMLRAKKMVSEILEGGGTSVVKTSQKQMSPPKSVGFSTANGKPIAISEKAMLRAKKMVSEILEGGGTSVEKTSQKQMSPPKSVGFSTANGKPTAIPEKAMLRAKKMESEIFESGVTSVDKTSQKLISPPKSVGSSTASGKAIAIPEKTMLTKKMESETFESDDASKQMSPPKSVGFSTASGEPIAISEKAMLAAKKILSDIFKSGVTSVDKTSQKLISPPKSVGSSTENGKAISISEKAMLAKKKTESETFESNCSLLEKSSQELMPPPPIPKVVSFSTASGKTISVSQKAMEEAKKKIEFDDFNDDGKENNATNIGPVPCTSNVFDFGNQSCLSPEESNEIEDLTRSLLEDMESEWVEEFTQQESQPAANLVIEPEKKAEPEIDVQKTRTSTKRRILEQYGEPPDLPSLCTPAKRGRFTKKFVPPRPADPK